MFNDAPFLGQVPLVMPPILGQMMPPPMPRPRPPMPPPHRRRRRIIRFFPSTTVVYPYADPYPQYSPPPGRMICRKLEEESKAEGRDVFECEPEYPEGTYTYGY